MKEAAAAALLDEVVRLARRAGEEILRRRGAPGEVLRKGDDSPLTEADRAAHRCLVEGLSELTPEVPILSEESPEEEIRNRREWGRFWLVDPLDGTKEFLEGSRDFTVNVALVEAGSPRLGVVHVPAAQRTYRAGPDVGAQVAEGESAFLPIHTRPFSGGVPVLAASRSHEGPGVQVLARRLGTDTRVLHRGSSVKFCMVAEGRADLYLRDGPTMEWDTGAAQCVVEHAGGGVFSLDGDPLRYNKPVLRNPPFIAVGDRRGPWRPLVEGLEAGR